MREILVSSSSDHIFYQMQPLVYTPFDTASCCSCNKLAKAEAEAVLSAYSSSLEYYQKNVLLQYIFAISYCSKIKSLN